jgi:hypothetical protein
MSTTHSTAAITDRLPAERPKCRQHGYMIVRPAAAQTKEQEFCGTWYDCPEYVGLRRCQSTVLLPSEGLRRQLGTF